MNRTEYLLTQAASECNEVAHRIAKALQFGLAEVQTGHRESNAERIVGEYVDLLAAMDMLVADGALALPTMCTVRALIDKKNAKVERYMEHARIHCGTLIPDAVP